MQKKQYLIIMSCITTILQALSIVTVEEGLSYDDVLVIPQKTDVVSRNTVDTQTQLTKKKRINIPIISSNMDSVTESEMAEETARLGGLGVIHRYNTPEEQAAHVRKVKKACNAVIKRPLTIPVAATIAQAEELIEQENISSLLVIDTEKTLVGIVTARDMRFKNPEATEIKQIMTGKNELITAQPNVSQEAAQELMRKHGIEKLPLIHPDGTIAGLITSKDITNKTKYPLASFDEHDRLMVGAAIGIGDDALERAARLVEAGVDVLVIDVAHGHSTQVIETIRAMKFSFPDIEIIAGNVATPEGTRDLIEAGADCIKVGVGPGSICTTRIATGSGYPQLSAIINCGKVAAEYGVPIIADGGIKTSGDITKAIAAGASSVMLGNMLAGTAESPGMIINKNGKRFKVLRGMASLGANLGRQQKTGKNLQAVDYVEGVEAIVPYKGAVNEIIRQLMSGLRSGMSYCGCHTINELVGNGHFVHITAGGMRESNVHDVQQIM